MTHVCGVNSNFGFAAFDAAALRFCGVFTDVFTDAADSLAVPRFLAGGASSSLLSTRMNPEESSSALDAPLPVP